MTHAVDLRILQLLCSRLCHDLAGPIGAVNNGIELMTEMGAGSDEEAMELVASSAREIARRLQYFRVAFGLSPGAVNSAAAAQRLAADYMTGGKISLDWTVSDADEQIGLTEADFKLLLNMILLGIEALPRGGVITPVLAPAADGREMAVTARGETAKPVADIEALVHPEESPEEITPRTVQGYFTTCLAQALGAEVAVSEPGAGAIALTAHLPSPA